MASAVSDLKSLIGGNARFNDEAANWDSRPFVRDASKRASEAILRRLQSQNVSTEKLDNLEIGCGTGILSFLLAPHLRQVVAIDAAEGMIEVLKQKISRPDAPKNIIPIAVLLEDPEDDALPPADGASGRKKFDLITSHLVLHHIPELEGVLRTMLGCLKRGGKALLTDFQNLGPQSRKFHPESKMAGVARDGINADEMKALMERVGFVNVNITAEWTMEKSVESFPGQFTGKDHDSPEMQGQGVINEFPFVVCYGEKASS